MKLATMHALGACVARLVGSSPTLGTRQEKSMPRGAERAARPPNRRDFLARNGTGGFRWEKKIFHNY